MTKNIKLLNLGCGARIHPAWTNVDFYPSPGVIPCDLLKGIPFADSSFDVVYHSHLLEHFPKKDAPQFIKECYRVLRPGGIIRIVVPDLERIAQEYLRWLKQAAEGDTAAAANYDWTMLEMFDQTVRQFPGGEMGKYLDSKDLLNREYILARIGKEAEKFWDRHGSRPSLGARIKQQGLPRLLRMLRRHLAALMAGIIGGPEAFSAIKEGQFRRSGEIHQWMYDRYSLGKLLQDTGFTQITVRKAAESLIPDFNSYGLDIENGETRKPDSLFIEAIKP